jgi:hypothetical protein
MICNSCGKQHGINGGPLPVDRKRGVLKPCPALKGLSGNPCGSTDYRVARVMELPAMPGPRTRVDLRSRS